MKQYATAAMACLALSAASVARADIIPRVVNKTAGPYTSIGAAVAASSAGDRILITDSAIYYEAVVIGSALTNLRVSTSPGEAPVVSGETLPANGSVITVSATGVQIEGVGVYVGGAQYGIRTTAGPTVVDRVSFDVHVPHRGGQWNFGLAAGADVEVRNSNFLGPDGVTAQSGGVLSNSAVPLHITVENSDFWGIGTAGGAIGVGQPAGSTLEVHGNVFGQTSTAGPIIAINNWGATTLNESRNAFRNINGAIVGFAGHALNPTDKQTTGSVNPVYVAATAMTEQTAANSLTQYLGCAVPQSFPYPDPTTLDVLLDRVVISNYYTFRDLPTARLRTPTLEAMTEMAPHIWEEFLISWFGQFDPAQWQQIRARVAEVRAQPGLSDIILMGNLMEAVYVTNLENTPMSHDFWLWFAYEFPDAAFRPLRAKVVSGRRLQAHWFESDALSGYGGWSFWGDNIPGSGIPNLRSSEGVAYFLYLTREMVDAGLNAIKITQPQLTFGQGTAVPNALSSQSLRTVVRFIKNYGTCRAPLRNGHRFALAVLSEVYNGFRDAATLVDYAEAPAGIYPYGAGYPWTSLEDAFLHLPGPEIPLAGKPLTLIIDNSGPGDQISLVAVEPPIDRNTWLQAFDQAVSALGYHLVLNGIRQLSPGWPQNFDGYLRPDFCGETGANPNTCWRSDVLLPFNAQGDMATTQAAIFNSH